MGSEIKYFQKPKQKSAELSKMLIQLTPEEKRGVGTATRRLTNNINVCVTGVNTIRISDKILQNKNVAITNIHYIET